MYFVIHAWQLLKYQIAAQRLVNAHTMQQPQQTPQQG